MTDPQNQRAGFAAIIGAPNAGKSTLTNRLVGAKVTIVTQKVQTTRFPVRGIAMEGDAQIVLVDTPGIFQPRRRLDRAMVRAAWGGADEADAIVHLVDAAAELTREQIVNQLHQELPYATAVETETWEDRADGSTVIHQQILVARDSQKAIVIGKGGARLRTIGQLAREEIAQHLGRKVHLFLHVKVNPRWDEDRGLYKDIGLEWTD